MSTHRSRPAMTPAPLTGMIRKLTGRRTRTALGLVSAAALAVTLFAINSAPAQAGEAVVQAEAFTTQNGAVVEATTDTGGGQNVAYLAGGDWLGYAAVDLGTSGSITAKVRVASAAAAGGTVELHADSLTGTMLAAFPITSTGGYQSWTTLTAETMPMLTGPHAVYVALKSPQAGDFVNLNWFSITTSSTPMPSMTMPTTPGTWISVDPVKQAADTKAFFARTPRPVTGDRVRVPEFHAGCAVNHRNNDDPIIFPGQVGASHNHSFFGNLTTDANSTTASLLAGATNCDPVEDKSAYWIPTLFSNGVAVAPAGDITVYYGSRLKDPSKIQPFPVGFRMIAGDAKKQVDTPEKQGNGFWCAGIGGEVGRSADGVTPICAPTANLTYQLVFPDCWDGVHLDSPNHKQHLSNTVDGACPAAFPVPIPNLSFVISWPLGMDTRNVTLASGTTFSMHGDFFNAWDENAQAERVRNCLDQNVKCNAAGAL